MNIGTHSSQNLYMCVNFLTVLIFVIAYNSVMR